MIVVAFLGAAAAGTLARWRLSVVLPPLTGTLVANLGGAFALGLLSGSSATSTTIVGIAALGSLTTFSTLVIEILELGRTRPRRALLYAAATIVGGIGLAWVGVTLS
ncbi:MAG: CrcB family protein [Acidimicrobiales bacterium]